MSFIGRKSVSILAMLPMCFSLATGARAQTPSNPTIRGFIVGAEYTQFVNNYKSAALGQGTPWWFGYRPDIPQAATTHAEVPVSYGPDSIYSGGYGNGDDWPSPLQHVVYNPSIANPGFNFLPSVDLFKHQTPYASNTGTYPGITSLNITASAQFPAETVSASGAHWGGFYGSLRGSNGSLMAQGFPWSSTGSDYGYYNAGDPNYKPYAPGPANVNFYIYDIRNSTPVIGSDGRAMYDLTSAPDNVSATTNKARGRLTLRRKDFSARWEYGFSAANIQYANTFILQGVWEIAAVEGSFTSVYSTADIGKGVGTYGQPQRFFPGLNYNDGNFYNVLANSSNTQKSMVYQFLPAGVSIVRTYDAVTNTIVETVTNNGDVDLSNLTLTDTAAGTSAPFNLAAGQTTTITLPLTSPYTNAGTATVTSNVFSIERGVDVNGVKATIADTSTNVSGVPDSSIIHVSANSSGTQLATDINVSGVVTAQKNGASAGVPGVTVTLTGTDLNGNPVTASTVTGADGSYSFPNVVPGTYHIVETAPSGYDVLDSTPGVAATKVSGTDLLVTANQKGTSSYTAENFQLAQQVGTVSGTLYVDANKNTSFDSGEAGISGVTVTLQDGNGKTVATTTTDANGNYSFTAVPVGGYTVVAPATAGGDALETGASLPVTVVATKNAPNNNFGYLLPVGSLSGVLYVDANKNSSLDGGETGLSGITVTLLDASGNTVATTTTDGTGAYSFQGITIGSYTVSAPATASGDTLETSASLSVAVTANKEAPNNNFGYLLPVGSLSGTLFVDADKDNTYDSNEAQISGITVSLLDASGATVATTTTDANGHYSFSGLAPAGYTVTAPSTAGGYALETSSSLAVTVVGGQDDADNDFGYITPVGSLSGVLYLDGDKNSQYTSGEALLSGVTVTLLDSTGKTVATTTTDSDGAYSFAGLNVGSYTVTAPASASGDALETSGSLSVSVSANQNTPNNNFGYVIPVGSLSGTLYLDANKNSTFNNGEAGISGITVNLLDASGNTVATTTTDGSGNYSFAGLTAGSYTVSAPSAAGGATLETAGSLSVAVTANQNAGGNNFGYVVPVVGSISGTLYIDANKNSSLDSGETGLSGLTVNLLDASGNIVATTTTDANGAYSFPGLTAGAYKVSAPSASGSYTLETSAILSVSVTGSQNSGGNNFGYIKPVATTGSICGTVYLDGNKNGKPDCGDSALGGVTVTLVDSTGKTVATTTTDANGNYSFKNVPSGTYKVVVPTTNGSYPIETTDPLTVTITGSQNVCNVNFGYTKPAVGALCGTVFIDCDKDGKYDSGETVLSGVTVTLQDSTGKTIATTTTDCNGNYSFKNLAPGSYKVVVPTSNGSYPIETTDPLTVAVTGNQTSSGNNFGYVKPAVGALCGVVYLDANKDGKPNSGDSALGGVTVTLVDSTGKTVATTTTDCNGGYSFKNLVPGSYKVTVPSAASGDNIETTNPLTVTVTGNQTTSNVNFGYAKPATGGLCGTLYYDANKDGKIDRGDSGLCGITVTLKNSAGKTVATTKTDSCGNYSFSGIAAGSYTVCAPTSVSGVSTKSGSLSAPIVGGQNGANYNFAYVKGSSC